MPENLIPLVQYKVKSDNLSLHFHEEYEILFVTDGMIEITVNNKAIIAQKGDVIFLNTYESHYTKVLKTPYKRYVLMLSPDILEKKIIDLNLLGIFKKRTADFKFCLHFNDQGIIKSFIEMIIKEVQKGQSDEYSEKVQLMLVEHILITALRKQRDDMMIYNRDDDINVVRLIFKVQSFLDDHFSENLRISDISQQFHISVPYFSSCFKQYVGQSPKKYLMQLRLNAASHKLTHTSESIIDIAYSVGFADVNNFIRRFKETFNLTPSQFRKIYTAGGD